MSEGCISGNESMCVSGNFDSAALEKLANSSITNDEPPENTVAVQQANGAPSAPATTAVTINNSIANFDDTVSRRTDGVIAAYSSGKPTAQ